MSEPIVSFGASVAVVGFTGTACGATGPVSAAISALLFPHSLHAFEKI